MSKKIIFSPLLFVLVLMVFSGCKKSGDPLGPQYGGAPADFSVTGNTFDAFNGIKATGGVLATTPTSVTIETRFQFYKATFSHKVGWKLTISSQYSNAVKTFSGFSDFLDSSNTKWYGESDNDYFFGFKSKADTVDIKLTFTGSTLVYTKKMVVNGIKKYHNVTTKGVYHYLIDDFEASNPLTSFSPFYPDQDDQGGGNTGNNAYSDIKNQGDYSYRMLGYDVNNNTYIGSCNTPTLNDILPNTFHVTDPEKMFVNLYIYGTGKPNTTVSVLAYENDAQHPSGVALNQSINDKYIYQIGVTWTGWKLVSFKYSSFRRPNTGAGRGNNRLNPERLSGMALEMDSYPTPGYSVEAMVDMIVVTENGVFQK